jgi:hypothetical protein
MHFVGDEREEEEWNSDEKHEVNIIIDTHAISPLISTQPEWLKSSHNHNESC